MIQAYAGDALELLAQHVEPFDLIATDPPYAFGGSGDEHAITATVAVVLRESARALKPGGWLVVMCAASWRSQCYMAESVRGLVEPVRSATWLKPNARTKVATPGWRWQSVAVMAFRKGKSGPLPVCDLPDFILAEPVMNGRRAALPPAVAEWMVAPWVVSGGVALDPFAGSFAIPRACEKFGMRAVGFERDAAAVAGVVESQPAPPLFAAVECA